MDSSRLPSCSDIVTTRLLRLIGTEDANDMGLAIVRRDLDVMRAKNAGIEISFRRLEINFFRGRVPDIRAGEYDPNRCLGARPLSLSPGSATTSFNLADERLYAVHSAV